MTRLLLIVSLALASMAPSAHAGSSGYGTELPFVIGGNARSSGLGMTGVARSGRASLLLTNPASLADVNRPGFDGFRTTFFDDDTNYITLSGAYPFLSFGTLGVGIMRLSVGGIEERDATNVLVSSDLKNSNTRVVVGYGMTVTDMVSLGINLKVDNQQLAGFSGSGVGGDLGGRFRRDFAATSAFRSVSAGLAVENFVEPSIKLDQESVADPTQVVLGTELESVYSSLSLTTALELVSPRHSPTIVRFGQEFSYQNMLALRFGADGSTLTYGVGGYYRGVSVDYAYREEDLGGNHRVSVAFDFGQSREQRRERVQHDLEQELQERLASRLFDLEQSQLADLKKSADAKFAAREWYDARSQYEMISVLQPDDAHALDRIKECARENNLDIGRRLMAEENYLAAADKFAEVLADFPSHPEALRLRSECASAINAAADRTQMIERQLSRSIDLYAARDYLAALNGFNQVLEFQPDNRLAGEYRRKAIGNIAALHRQLLNQADQQSKRGEFGDALTTLEKARELRPDDGATRQAIESVQRAISERRQAQTRPTPAETAPKQRKPAVDPEVLEARYAEGVAAFESGDFRAATRALSQVWAADPNYNNAVSLLARAYLLLGMQHYAAGRYDEAIDIWERALTVQPDNTKARRYLTKAKEEASRLSNQ